MVKNSLYLAQAQNVIHEQGVFSYQDKKYNSLQHHFLKKQKHAQGILDELKP